MDILELKTGDAVTILGNEPTRAEFCNAISKEVNDGRVLVKAEFALGKRSDPRREVIVLKAATIF